ncbi:ROK family protein [Vibrio sp. 10N]|nr:ROK family protein [Vibrio sp. 10N]
MKTTMTQKDDLFLTLDFGGSSVKGAVMSRDAQIHERFSLASQADTYEQWLDTFTPLFDELAARFALKGIAISTCGAVNVDSGVIEGASALPYIHDIDVRSLYQTRFNLPVELENDGCCAALAEDWLGAGKEDDEFCLLVLGSGIGGAIVRDGAVIKGTHLHAGEFGYCILRFEQGQPITYSNAASTRALVENVALAKNQKVEDFDGVKVFSLYEQGDNDVLPLVEQWYGDLATILFNVQYSLDPKRILLGGAVSRSPRLIDNINRKLDELQAWIPIARIRPVPALTQFGNDANLIGALKHFLNRQG